MMFRQIPVDSDSAPSLAIVRRPNPGGSSRPDPRALSMGLLAMQPNWLLLDAQGRVCDLSRQARSRLGPLFDLDAQGCLKTARRADQEALSALVGEAISEPRPGWSGTIVLGGPEERDVLALVALSLGLDGAVILLHDLYGPHEGVLVPLLAQLGLSAAEARVALRIGRGESPAAAATAMRVSQDTVRTQLRSVFAKLGFSRQSQLSVLITRLESCLPPPVGLEDASARVSTPGEVVDRIRVVSEGRGRTRPGSVRVRSRLITLV